MAKSDERNLFREYVRDVKPLVVEERHTSRPKPSPVARFTRADRREVLRESLLPPQDETLLCTGDELSFRRPHVPERILTKLRRGHYVVDAEIDLHGLTAAEARGALRECSDQVLQIPFTFISVLLENDRRPDAR